jgi:hypothetical protein
MSIDKKVGAENNANVPTPLAKPAAPEPLPPANVLIKPLLTKINKIN